jgi:hypothetical protein
MIPEEVYSILIIVAILALVGWAGHHIYRGIVDEPETHGDDGGHPTPTMFEQPLEEYVRVGTYGKSPIWRKMWRKDRAQIERTRKQAAAKVMPAPDTGSSLLAGDRPK